MHNSKQAVTKVTMVLCFVSKWASLLSAVQDLRKVQKFVGKGDSCKGGKISKNVFNLAISPKIGAIQYLRRQIYRRLLQGVVGLDG